MTTLETMEKVLIAVRGASFFPNNERELQEKLSQVLNSAGILHEREKPVTPTERLDFFIEDGAVCIEVKMHSNEGNLRRQVKRYEALPEVGGIVIIARTNVDMSEWQFAKPIWQIPIWKQMI